MAARSARWDCRRLESIRWTDPQRQLLAATESVVIFWGANQIGKSWALAADALLFLRGEHPHDQTHRPPVTVLYLGESWKQMVAAIRTLWGMIDKRQMPKLRLDGGMLKGQKYAVYDLREGPGMGSQLILGTFEEGAQRWAGFAAHRVVCDEPMPKAIYGELYPRLVRWRGHMRIGFTPTLGTAEDLRYLWDLADGGQAREIKVPLSLDAITPRGGLVETPWHDQAWLDDFEAHLLPTERDMRMGRSRFPLAADRYLMGWGEHLIRPDPCPAGARLGVGIDHGSGAGRQRAVIVGVRIEGHEQRVWTLNEVYSDGRTTPQEDARGILRALEEVGQSIRDVDVWIGDRSHAGDKWGGYKSNALLVRAFSEALNVHRSKLPLPLRRMRVPYKTAESMEHGCRVLNALMLADHLWIHPRCQRLPVDLAEWRGDRTDPCKDGIDALRYIVVDLVDVRGVRFAGRDSTRPPARRSA